MQCQAAARCPKKINPVRSLAVREAWLAAIVREHLTLSHQTVSACTVLIDCLTLCSQSLSAARLAQTKWQKVCACVCLNTLHRLRTYLRQKERGRH